MSDALLQRMVDAKLRHAAMLETRMMALLPLIKRGDEEARRQYEWYLQAAKTFPLKDLVGLAKLLTAEEVSADFDGFDDN